jgi:hypothetical protein
MAFSIEQAIDQLQIADLCYFFTTSVKPTAALFFFDVQTQKVRVLTSCERFPQRDARCPTIIRVFSDIIQRFPITKDYFLFFSWGDHPSWEFRSFFSGSSSAKTPMMLHCQMIPNYFFWNPDKMLPNLPVQARSWENAKQLAKERYVPWKEKESIAFFVGSMDSKFHFNNARNVRSIFQAEVARHKDFHVVDAEDAQSKFYKWSKYRYLINLGGHYPWTDRFPFLMLCGCVVIDVPFVIADSRDQSGEVDHEYIQWCDSLFKNAEHYVKTFPIVLTDISTSLQQQDTPPSQLTHALIQEAVKNIKKRIEYFESAAGTKRAQQIAQRAYDTAMSIDRPMLEDAVIDFLQNAQKFTPEVHEGARKLTPSEVFEKMKQCGMHEVPKYDKRTHSA